MKYFFVLTIMFLFINSSLSFCGCPPFGESEVPNTDDNQEIDTSETSEEISEETVLPDDTSNRDKNEDSSSETETEINTCLPEETESEDVGTKLDDMENSENNDADLATNVPDKKTTETSVSEEEILDVANNSEENPGSNKSCDKFDDVVQKLEAINDKVIGLLSEIKYLKVSCTEMPPSHTDTPCEQQENVCNTGGERLCNNG